MSKSEKSEDADKEQSRYVTWAVLIGAGLVWWFYPQIRAAVQPATGQIEGTKTTESTELLVIEDEVVVSVVVETPIVDVGQTELLPDIETKYPAPETDKPIAVEPNSAAVPIEETIVILQELDQTAVVGTKDESQSPISVEVETEANSTDELATLSAPIAPQPIIIDIAVPRFDLVRIEDDGSALIAGRAEGTGYVILSVDGVEFPGARSNLNGSGQFVIFAFLPPKLTPQALRLNLYTDGENGLIVSDEIVFVAAAPKNENQEEVVASVSEDTAEIDPELEALPQTEDVVASVSEETAEIDPQPEPVMQTEASAGSATTKVLLVDETGVKILQDGEETGPFITVSIDTISYNLQGDVSIGGRAAGRGFVRIYLDNRAITTSQISDSGYWTVDLLNVEAGLYTLRVDELNSVGDVMSRSETPFKREEPTELAALMAETDEVAVDDAAEAETVAAASDTLKSDTAGKVQQESEITQTVVDVQAQVKNLAASASDIYFEVEASGASSKGVGGEPVELDAYLRAPSATFRVKTVQPGSTLWAIAKESYGAGIEYFKVFDANKERIRDPDLIYPGQVFEIPD
ncbi:MAG: LysM peptidoglycan-binding domain-containing protein [Planktomarina sp.]|nr:LysM peptidoglycan-binding domain-containing protein [Planktomarina sp.]